MSTKAGRVTMKDVRQGKTFWKVTVRHLLMPNEYTQVEEEIINYAWPVRVRVDMKISIEGVQNKMSGFGSSAQITTGTPNNHALGYNVSYKNKKIT